jgi:transposase
MISYAALAHRSHGGRPTVALVLSAEERERVEAALRPATAEQRIVRRATALLMMADGVPGTDIARLLGLHIRTVQEWRRRFDAEHPADKLVDAPRPGRPPSLSRTPMPRASKPRRVDRPKM